MGERRKEWVSGNGGVNERRDVRRNDEGAGIKETKRRTIGKGDRRKRAKGRRKTEWKRKREENVELFVDGPKEEEEARMDE